MFHGSTHTISNRLIIENSVPKYSITWFILFLFLFFFFLINFLRVPFLSYVHFTNTNNNICVSHTHTQIKFFYRFKCFNEFRRWTRQTEETSKKMKKKKKNIATNMRRMSITYFVEFDAALSGIALKWWVLLVIFVIAFLDDLFYFILFCGLISAFSIWLLVVFFFSFFFSLFSSELFFTLLLI